MLKSQMAQTAAYSTTEGHLQYRKPLQRGPTCREIGVRTNYPTTSNCREFMEGPVCKKWLSSNESAVDRDEEAHKTWAPSKVCTKVTTATLCAKKHSEAVIQRNATLKLKMSNQRGWRIGQWSPFGSTAESSHHFYRPPGKARIFYWENKSAMYSTTSLVDMDTVPNFMDKAYLRLHYKYRINCLEEFKLRPEMKESIGFQGIILLILNMGALKGRVWLGQIGTQQTKFYSAPHTATYISMESSIWKIISCL